MIARTVLAVSVLVFAAAGTRGAETHEEQVVRATYATLSFLCELDRLSVAVTDTHATINEGRVERDMASATPQFIITKVQTGTIASIASRSWTTLFSVPSPEEPTVLKGSSVVQNYSEPETPSASWHTMRMQWDVDGSYNASRVAEMQAVTVEKAIELAEKDNWDSVHGTYTRYATFEVMLTFEGRTIGPYTASFLFGTDPSGKEVVAPLDSIVSGQLLWDTLRKPAYPAGLLRSASLRKNPIVLHWAHDHESNDCSSARADLCCADDRCALKAASVSRDLADTTHKP